MRLRFVVHVVRCLCVAIFFAVIFFFCFIFLFLLAFAISFWIQGDRDPYAVHAGVTRIFDAGDAGAIVGVMVLFWGLTLVWSGKRLSPLPEDVGVLSCGYSIFWCIVDAFGRTMRVTVWCYSASWATVHGILTLTGCNCTSYTSSGYAHGSPQVNLPWNSCSDTHMCKQLVMEFQCTIIHNIIAFFLA